MFQVCSLPFLYLLRIIWQMCATYDSIIFALPPRANLLFFTKLYQNFATFMTTTANSTTAESNYQDYVDPFLGLVDILSSLSVMRMVYEMDYLLLTVAMGLWVPCKYFSEILKKDNVPVPEILEMFEDLKIYSDLLNEVLNGLVVPFVLDVVFYYSIHLMDFVIVESIPDLMVLTICVFVTIGTFYFAAESCTNVSPKQI